MKLINTADAAARLGVSTARIQKLIWDGRLRAQMIGRDYVMNEDDLKSVENRQPGRPSAQLQRDYWTAFDEYLIQQNSRLKRQTPRPQRYMDFPIGRGLRIAANIRITDRQVWVDLTFNNKTKKFFHQLQERRTIIAEALSKLLEADEIIEWHEPANREERFVLVRKQNVDPTDYSNWPEQHEWLLNKLHAFYDVLEPEIRRLHDK